MPLDDLQLPISLLSNYLRLTGPLKPEWLEATTLALYCSEAAVTLGSTYKIVHEHGRCEPLVVGVEEWRDRLQRLLDKFGDRAYALFPALVQVRSQRGPFTLGSITRPSAHLAALDLAWLLIRASERIRGGTLLRPPEEIPIIGFPDLRILTQEIVFEAAAASNARPAPAPPSKWYVDLSQMAAIVNKRPRTFDHYKKRKKDPLPTPDIERGGGTAHEWEWSKIRPWLERNFKRDLSHINPENIPRGGI